MKFSLKQFIAALIVAAWYSCRTQGGCLSKGKGILAALFTDQPRVPQDIQEERAKTCGECPIFIHRRQTCGSPYEHSTWDDNGNAMGCFCYMPMKIRTQCNCWLYDETRGEIGWARNLNSFPLVE